MDHTRLCVTVMAPTMDDLRRRRDELSTAELVDRVRGRAASGLVRVGFVVLGLAVGILLGYLVLSLFGWSPDRTPAGPWAASCSPT